MAEQVALITGASRGIGFHTAAGLLEKGFRVACTARTLEKAKSAINELGANENQALAVPLDVAHFDQIEPAVKAIMSAWGRIDVLINNAGIFEPAPYEIPVPHKATLEGIHANDLERTLRINTFAPYLLCQQIVPIMKKQAYGRIVNVSSIMGQLASMSADWPAYRISKTALNAVTCLFADETKGDNILVNSVHPGWVSTDMGGEKAPKSPQDAAADIVWMATLPDGEPTGRFFDNRKPIGW